MEMATAGKNNGANDVFVGGVPVRAQESLKKRVFELNEKLRSLCDRHNFVFIDNSKITKDNLYDGVHLTKEGTRILASNYIEALRDRFNGWMDYPR